MPKPTPPGYIRSHMLTLWLDGQLWEHGFLSDPPGTVSLYSSTRYPLGTEFTVDTLPAGVKICPNLTHGLSWAPLRAQDSLKKAALKYGFQLFEIDIVPW